ncbi:methyl-accepting chemotaxis protein [Paenibacillus physcomitrellae]|uniref:methyl-accepting chemotaxis protein n=1 Tax=Paenibacillus physcomitrellae TaxID=1619311 RepID=UPI001FD49B66|nr:HAMP domain-containing methyl-accepting chemotaxis protein [Paenibacillus physcomitrellae]
MRHLKIRQKLLILNLTAIVFLLLIGGTGYYYVNLTVNNSKVLYEQSLMKVKMINELKSNFNVAINDVLSLVLTQDENQNHDLNKNYDDMMKSNQTLLEEYKTLINDKAEQTQYESLMDQFQRLVKDTDQMVALGLSNKNDEAYQTYNNQIIPNKTAVERSIDVLTQNTDQDSKNHYDESVSAGKTAKTVSIALVVLAVLLLGLIAFMLVRLITRPLANLEKLMEKAAGGDLTVKGTYLYKDEAGKLTLSFNQMVNSLRSLVIEVNEKSAMLAASSEQLTAVSESAASSTEHISRQIQEISDGTDSQARGSAEVSRTMQEMTKGISRIAESTGELVETSRQSEHNAVTGHEYVTKAIQQMEQIHESVVHLAQAVEELNRKSENIGDITNTINDIAAQTSLLSLNAAIEAARAGEEGRGFAVVAAEVKKLAEQTGQSANNVSSLIGEIQNDTSKLFSTMESSKQYAQTGQATMRDVGHNFENILQNIRELSAQLQDVSAVTEQMSASSEEVLASAETSADIADNAKELSQSVAAAAQEQLASVEEVSGSASHLSGLAQELQASIERFKV